ncbi:MAG: hypothetical protein R3F36_06425 [Candidatus Competibacteraceae bacterium]
MDGFEVATIASRFSYTLGGETLPGIPPFYRASGCRGNCPADGPVLGLSLGVDQDLLGPAMAIALLGAIGVAAVRGGGRPHDRYQARSRC